MDIEHAADALWTGIKMRRHMPEEWSGKLTLAQGFAVQLAVLERRMQAGERHAGWKVGLTSAAMRLQQGVVEPCFGYLLQSGEIPSGATLPYAGLINPGIENELCITMGDTLKGPDVTLKEALQAIGSIQPALELVEVRGNFSADLPLAMADNAQQYGFIIGEPVAFDPSIELEQVSVDVRFNDASQITATGKEVMGNPANSLVWLAGKLHEYGLSLEAGMTVMSGSFTRQFSIQPNDVVESRFSSFGAVRVRFSA